MPSHPSKRKRPSEQNEKIQDKHTLFTQWAQDRGVEINGIQPASLSGRGIGLITTRKIREGERILFIPEKAMFKPDTSRLRRESLEEASPQAQLAISALLSFEAEHNTPLKIWKDTWPTREDFVESMPMCWSSSHQDLLPPPVHQPLARQLADYRKDWDAARATCAKHDFSEEDFRYFWLIVNSRSFHWKPPRGNRGGSMVLCPFIDYMNHGASGSGCNVSQGPKGYEVVADRDYAPKAEILATYGPHPNEKLLLHYGFLAPTTNPDDELRLDHLLLPHLPTAQLQDTGFLGNYVLSPAANDVCFKTEVAVRAKLLTANEWEYFIGCGEDLGEDFTGEVRGFVAGLLRGWRPEVVGMIERLQQEEEGVPGMLLLLRWRQILEAIDAFSE